jgi:hypothetical protein
MWALQAPATVPFPSAKLSFLKFVPDMRLIATIWKLVQCYNLSFEKSFAICF